MDADHRCQTIRDDFTKKVYIALRDVACLRLRKAEEMGTFTSSTPVWLIPFSSLDHKRHNYVLMLHL